MCSSEKMDWVVQKATELGAAEIQPVQTQRSVARLSSERAEKRTEHWRSVAIAACEQCGRNTLPQTHAPRRNFSAWLDADAQYHQRQIHLATRRRHHSAPPTESRQQGTITLLIGPGGRLQCGRSAYEAHQAGFVPILLGPRVLRTETAALAGINRIANPVGAISSN